MALGRVQLAIGESPAIPGFAGQLVAAVQADQPVRGVRDVMPAAFPVMQSAFADLKKLRSLDARHASTAVHVPKSRRNAGAGVWVMAAQAVLLF